MSTVDIGQYLPSTKVNEGLKLLNAIRMGRTLGLSPDQYNILLQLLPTGLFERDGNTFRWKS